MATYWENSCSFGLRYVSWYKYLIVSLVFSHLGFWSGNLFLIAPFPDLCLLVPFCTLHGHVFAMGISVHHCASFFDCTPVGRVSVSMIPCIFIFFGYSLFGSSTIASKCTLL